MAASGLSKFCKAKGKERRARSDKWHYQGPKEVPMEYLIVVAVVSVMALYALIIVVCLKQPEW
jgi:hypothetical protein